MDYIDADSPEAEAWQRLFEQHLRPLCHPGETDAQMFERVCKKNRFQRSRLRNVLLDS
jgi:hypothetical protein